MQIHKKDIVWPEAGVVRKRGRRVETGREKKREEKTFSLASLSSLQCLQSFSLSCFHENITMTEGRSEYLFFEGKIGVSFKSDGLENCRRHLIN